MVKQHLRVAAFGISTALLATAALTVGGLWPEQARAHGTFAAGDPGDPKKPTSRTIEIVAREAEGKMSYTPDKIEVKRGEQIRFVIRNEGEL
ncbi:MAG: copper resistance protein, partial [Geminicoccaceae bacterium]